MSRHFNKPNITVSCQSDLCRLGTSLGVVDVNGDDQDDLVIGEQYYRPTDNQTGVVTALYSRRTYKEQENVTVEELLEKWKLVGHQVFLSP